MGAMLGKAFFAVVLWATAAHLWSTARGWERDGEAPAGDDALGLIRVGQAGFRRTIIWHKMMAAMIGLFAVLTTGSLLYDIARPL